MSIVNSSSVLIAILENLYPWKENFGMQAFIYVYWIILCIMCM